MKDCGNARSQPLNQKPSGQVGIFRTLKEWKKQSSALFGQTLVLILHLLPLADLVGCSRRSDFILWDYTPEIRINCAGAANVLTISLSGWRVIGDLWVVSPYFLCFSPRIVSGSLCSVSVVVVYCQ